MDEYLKFDSSKYEFGLIQQLVEKHYSLNTITKPNKETFENAYNGNDEIGEIIYDNVGVAENYKTKWHSFIKFLRQQLKQPVNGTIYLSAPSFQGHLTIERITGHHYELTKELHFAVSLLGPYYTIYGLDKSVRMLQREPRPPVDEKELYGYYDATHAVVVSPCFEYESHFSRLKDAIAARFPSYRFVPFAINKMRIPGLYASMSAEDDKDANRIYSALFNNTLDFSTPTRGDSYYGYDNWQIPETLTAEDIANKEIITQHIYDQLNAASQPATIHRVWQYKSTNGWKPFLQANGIGMMSVETVDILDLTDFRTVRYIKPQSAKVYCQFYQLVADELIIQTIGKPLTFRIAHIAPTELRLMLVIDVNIDSKKIQGEVCEFLFTIPE